MVGEIKLGASNVQAQRLAEWAEPFGRRNWAVESASGLGYLLSQQLVACGETVFNVPPVLASRVRVLDTERSHKNDPNDARSVAIAALRSDRLRVVEPDDHVVVLRLLVKRHRDMARLRNKHCTRLHALLCELEPGGISTEITVNKANQLLERVETANEAIRHRVLIARELVDDIARLDTTLKTSKQRIRTAVSASGTSLCEIRGIGPICAAIILGYTGDIGRFPTKGHYATAPIEVSSANKTRHRLNLRGNRTLNHAIHIAAVTQLRYPGEGRDYYDKKIAKGKTTKETIRALKRRISDAVYKRLIADGRQHQTG